MEIGFTDNSIIQAGFIVFPGYSNKFPSPSDFTSNTSSIWTCMCLCLMHVGCNVVFYDNKTSYCSGADDTELMAFLGKLTVQSGPTGYRLSSECDLAGYTLNRGTGQCLKIVTELKSWYDASQYCEDNGGVLVKLETTWRMSGAHHISQIYLDDIRDFFVGASDIAAEGQWVWQDGVAVVGIPTSFNDLDGNFSPPAPANCARIATNKLILKDDSCDALKSSICERRELEPK